MRKFFFQIMQMGLIMIYGFIVLDEKESAIKSVNALMHIARYLQKTPKEKDSLEEEYNNLMHIAELRALKESADFKLDIDRGHPNRNIYIERFSLFQQLATYLLNEAEIGHFSITHSLDKKSAEVTIKLDMNDCTLKVIKLSVM